MTPNKRWTEDCSESLECQFCTGEACNLCGTGGDCEHDSYERHCSWTPGWASAGRVELRGEDVCVLTRDAVPELEAENARLRAALEERAVAKLEARLALADRLADWIEGRVEEDHPEACAGRLCVCQTLAAYRASAEVLRA